jgi:adenylate cyclase
MRQVVKKVLVAEDHAESRQILYDVLTTVGYQVTLAENGDVAVAATFRELPDLVILDVNMPGKDGFAVVEALKQDPATNQIPIILLTAQSQVDNRVKGLGLGAEDFISKPYSPKELLARVDARLRTKLETDELRKQRQLLRVMFERFVSPEVVEALMRNPEAARLGGAVREITVLFADLEGFTSLSERLDPQTLLSILNQYHGLLVTYIKRNGGTIDKFLGDGLMAIFNAPVEQEHHSLRAVRSAYEIHRALPEFYHHAFPDIPLQINFGIHTGPAVVGNVGTPEVMNYTAVGDTVNLAERLQSLSKGGVITISQATYQQVAGYVDVRDDGLRQVRGREELVQTYQVVGLKPVEG